MMFFGRDKRSDAASKQQEAEIDMAIAARISAVVADHSPGGAEVAPDYAIPPHMLDGTPSSATSHDPFRDAGTVRDEPGHSIMTLTSGDEVHATGLSDQRTETDGWGHKVM